MRKIPLALSAALVCGTAQAQVKDTSFRDADGHRVQQLELTVNATPANVWDAFTTDKGFSSWAVPVAHITLGNDGMMESSYKLDGRIGEGGEVRARKQREGERAFRLRVADGSTHPCLDVVDRSKQFPR